MTESEYLEAAVDFLMPLHSWARSKKEEVLFWKAINRIKVRAVDLWSGNFHSCIHCELTVSFCDNCSTDHHEKGYESCLKKATEAK